MCRRGIAGSHGDFMFDLWEKAADSESCSSTWRFHRQCLRAPVSPQPLLLPVLSRPLCCLRRDVPLKFWFASPWLMADDIEHLFICFSDTCRSSLEKFLLSSFAHFKIGLLCFYYWVVGILYEFKILLRLYEISKYFLPHYGFSFHFLDDILWYIKVLNFYRVKFMCFFHWSFVLGVI